VEVKILYQLDGDSPVALGVLAVLESDTLKEVYEAVAEGLVLIADEFYQAAQTLSD